MREAFARAGTGDDFVIREMDPSDPRPGPAPDGGESGARSTVADAASAVAAAASSGDTQAARDAADAARTAAGDAADAVREAASSAREAVDDKGVADAASDYASTAATAAQRDWSRYAPVGGLFLVLLPLLRRGRR